MNTRLTLESQLKKIANEYVVKNCKTVKSSRYMNGARIPLWCYCQQSSNRGKTILDIESQSFNFADTKWSIAKEAAQRIGKRKNLTALQMNELFTILYGKLVGVGRTKYEMTFSFLGCFNDSLLVDAEYHEKNKAIISRSQNHLRDVVIYFNQQKSPLSLGFIFDERVTNISLLLQMQYVMGKKIKVSQIKKEK